MSNFSFDTTVCDGMPCECFVTVEQPDPDVGIFNHYIEDIYLEVKGKRAEWLERRMTSQDWASLEEKALEEYYNAQ